MAILYNVPDVSRECFDKCMGISVDIYQEYANHKCNEYLSAAKTGWAGKDLNRVEENLGKITRIWLAIDAMQLVEQITAAVEAEEPVRGPLK